MALTALVLFAGSAAAEAAGPGSKVHGLDAESEALISAAREASRTVAALLSALEQTDLIVMVRVTSMPDALKGDTRLLAATKENRHLLLRVHAGRSSETQIETLGHELQHALEIAAASDVRNEAGLVRLFARIGDKTGNDTYETDAALRVARQIHDEIVGAHPRR